MEREAVARYTEFADTMETHNNREVAQLFRKMAGYEQQHADQILAEMGWADDVIAPRNSTMWAMVDAPETVAIDEVHYLMQPWHALKLALAAEQRALAFFGNWRATRPAIRSAAPPWSCTTRRQNTWRSSRRGWPRCPSRIRTGPTTPIRRATSTEPTHCTRPARRGGQ